MTSLSLPEQNSMRWHVDRTKNDLNPINSLKQIVTEKIKSNSALILKSP